MPQVINTNIASLTAQRNLNSSQKLSDTALQRLSSGLRINSSKDDAAGLAISTRFDAQIRGSNQAIRNSSDAIALAQTAEGGLKSITVALQRMRELSVQAANDTNTAVDRQALQEEVSQLVAEIKSISEDSNFNGRKLLDGSFSNATFQTGSNVGETISFGIAKVGSDSLGNAQTAGVSSRTGATALHNGTNGDALVAGDLVINGIAIAASVGSDDNASTAEGRSSSIAKAAAINRESAATGVVATVDVNYVKGSTGALGDNVAAVTGSMTINGVVFDFSTNSTLTGVQNLVATADVINAESGVTGVRAVAGDYTTQGITLIADDGRNIQVNANASATLADDLGINSDAISTDTADVYVGTFSLISTNGTDIEISTDTGNIDTAGFEVGTYSGTNSGVVSEGGSTALTGAGLQTVGDLVINGVSVGSTSNEMDTFSSTNKQNSAISRALAINEVSDETGVVAVAQELRLYGGNIAAGDSASNMVINGVSVSVNFNSTDDIDVKLNTIINAVNDSSGLTGVTAEALDGDSVTLIAADGRNVTITGGNSMLGGGMLSTSTYTSAVALEGAGPIELSTLTNDIENWGFRVGRFGGGEAGTKLDDIDITTVAGATDAITAVDNALATVASISATLGAVQNRFDSVISNLQLRSENLSAANSQITDADFAAETAKLTKSQVLQQAGISVLAQANARPQQVLSLLG